MLFYQFLGKNKLLLLKKDFLNEFHYLVLLIFLTGSDARLCLNLTNRLMVYREFHRIGNETQLMGLFM